MKKNLLLLTMLLLMFSTFPALSAAPETDGKIIDILDNGVITIQFSKKHPFRTGDTINLTYMAGSLPMAIGDYQITTTTNIICLAKPLVMNMPPSNGMAVKIASVNNPRKIVGMDKKPAPAIALSPKKITEATEITGSVITVNGDEITVKITGLGNPQPGWFIDLFYVTSQGKKLPVGTWKVQSVAGKNLNAIKINGVGNANISLKAVIYNRKKPTPSQAAIPPKRPHTASAPFAASRKATAASNRQPQSFQLLGQTPPAPSARKIAPNPRKNLPSLPPGVKKTAPRTAAAKPQDPKIAQLLNQLKSTNLKEKRTAAKIISRERFEDSVLYNQVEKELLNGYLTARDKLAVDTMAWMCKALASSKNHKYYDTVYTVSRKAKSRKVKKHAKKSLRQLK